jgi:hypothetical protein
MTAFLSFFDIMAGYRGIVALESEALRELESSWLEGVKADHDLPDTLTLQTLRGFDPIPYVEQICLPRSPGTAELLVLVAADGSVNPDILLLKETGYNHFNTVAERMVRQYDFPATPQPSAYRVEMAVNYDPADCQWPPSGVDLPDAFLEVVNSYVGPEQTLPLDAAQAQQRWLSELQTAGKIDQATVTRMSDPDLKVAYPSEYCLPIAPTPMQLGLLLDGEGEPMDRPVLLRSSGYRTFDRQAQRLVADYDFGAGEPSRAVVFNVSVDYNPLTQKTLDGSEEGC